MGAGGMYLASLAIISAFLMEVFPVRVLEDGTGVTAVPGSTACAWNVQGLGEATGRWGTVSRVGRGGSRGQVGSR